MPLTMAKKITILVAFPVLLEIVIVGALCYVLAEVEGARARTAHANELGTVLYSILSLEMERSTVAVVRKMTSNASASAEETSFTPKVFAQVQKLRDLTKGNSEEEKTWSAMIQIEEALDHDLKTGTVAFDAGDKLGAALAFARARKGLDNLLRTANGLADEQDRVEKENRRLFEKYSEQLKIVLTGAIVSSVGLAFLLAYLFNKSTTNRLNILMQNALLFSSGRTSHSQLQGDDELAQLDWIYRRLDSELTTMRQKERAILDNTSEVICSIDRRLKLQETNKATLKVWGYHEKDLKEQSVLKLVAPDQANATHTKLAEAISSKSEVKFETKMRKPDGTIIDVDWSATWADDQQALFCVIRDITERKKLEQLKQDFVAMLSHDLRTPLSSVLAAIELVSMPGFGITDEGQEYLQVAEKNLHSSIAMINQLLEIEKMESGVLSLDYEEADSIEIIRAAVNTVAALSETANIPIVVPDDNVKVAVDIEKLTRVIINLLGNALKFSEPGKEIAIKQTIDNQYLRISVVDHGPGIPREKQLLIFERFRQLDQTEKREYSGTGLGLAICKSIIEAHKGKIGVTSQNGEGSTFWFEVPLQRPLPKSTEINPALGHSMS
jgi:PAS domain S-box-containing protein